MTAFGGILIRPLIFFSETSHEYARPFCRHAVSSPHLEPRRRTPWYSKPPLHIVHQVMERLTDGTASALAQLIERNLSRLGGRFSA